MLGMGDRTAKVSASSWLSLLSLGLLSLVLLSLVRRGGE